MNALTSAGSDTLQKPEVLRKNGGPITIKKDQTAHGIFVKIANTNVAAEPLGVSKFWKILLCCVFVLALILYGIFVYLPRAEQDRRANDMSNCVGSLNTARIAVCQYMSDSGGHYPTNTIGLLPYFPGGVPFLPTNGSYGKPGTLPPGLSILEFNNRNQFKQWLSDEAKRQPNKPFLVLFSNGDECALIITDYYGTVCHGKSYCD